MHPLLTAILANKNLPTQDITSIASFGEIGAPVCVRENAAQQAFLSTFYPQLKMQPVPGLTQAGLLPAIASGKCKGGVGPGPELQYALGGPGIFDADGFDPNSTFCNLETVGDLLTFGYYGIPFSKVDRGVVNETTLHAISVLVDLAIDTGNYTTAAKTYFPEPSTRPTCAKQDAALQAAIAASASEALELEDMSGLFVMEGAALVVALFIRFRNAGAGALRRRRASVLERKMRGPTYNNALFGGAEERPAWDTPGGGPPGDEGVGDVDGDDDDDGLETHVLRAPEGMSFGGMEGRLTELVAERTDLLAEEIAELRMRDLAFQNAIVAKLGIKMPPPPMSNFHRRTTRGDLGGL